MEQHLFTQPEGNSMFCDVYVFRGKTKESIDSQGIAKSRVEGSQSQREE